MHVQQVIIKSKNVKRGIYFCWVCIDSFVSFNLNFWHAGWTEKDHLINQQANTNTQTYNIFLRHDYTRAETGLKHTEVSVSECWF